MPNWMKYDVRPLSPEIEARLREALTKRRILLDLKLGAGQHIRIASVPYNDLTGGGMRFWVHWFGKDPSEPWPPEDSEYILAKSEKTYRVVTWAFPNATLAAELVRELWGVEWQPPADLASNPS